MYRRRRKNRESIAFGFDSFLDVVANVIGIILRLILVAWVGGRSYHALMERQAASAPTPAALPAPRRADDPLDQQIARLQADLDAARARLAARVGDVEVTKNRRGGLEVRLASLVRERTELEGQDRVFGSAGSATDASTKLVALSMDEVRKRQQELQAALKDIEAQPAPQRVLRYRTPVSRAVHADEVFFECRAGRVAFVDISALLHEVQSGLEQKTETLRSTFRLEEATAPVGAFRLKYVIERERDALDDVAGTTKPRTMFNFRYGVAEWFVEPIAPERGESLAAALAPGSAFSRVVGGLDAATVITFWVYPDSFETFRMLRDHLYERGLEVAGRPLPHGAPIGASRHGSASRGQ